MSDMENGTERGAATTGAEEMTALMAGILDSLQTNVFLCDENLKIVAINSCARSGLRRMRAEIQAAYGVDVDQLIGVPIQRFSSDPERVEALLGDPLLLPHATEIEIASKTYRARIDALRTPQGRISGYAVVCEDVSRLRAAERELRASLRQRATLLREVHERVKNNLDLIAGLVRLESGADAAPAPGWAERLRSIERVHELIYAGGDASRVDLDAYVDELARGVVAERAPRIKVETAVHADIRDLDRLIFFGLILHELVSNAVAHGFPDGRAGCVRVTARAVDGTIEAVVSDDGVGLPAGETRRSGLGLRLVCALIEERLGGSWKIESRGGGLACLFAFPVEAGKKS